MGNTRYLLTKNNVYDLDFELIYISKSKFENDWHSTLHMHPFTEIFFITSGQGTFQIGDEIVSVKESDLILINPNCSHTERSVSSSNPLEYIVFAINNLAIGISPSTLNEDNSKDALNTYKVLNFNKKKSEILYNLNTLINELEEKNLNYELACKSILTLFLIQVMRNTSSDIFITENFEKVNIECMKIKNYIDSHYSENITLDFLSNLTYVNKFHLVHLFTKEMGISPINYLINKRIDESKNLLITTNYSIRDISSIVGFSNSSYFSQMFKKIAGISPKDFRLNNSKKQTENKLA
ncbi:MULTISPECIES: AraC family transcriptional regulator [Clostridium]|uniref:AraC family transcriptional regulator n=1 Tax=Clostridium disporicum TaxID=84024 RepID=A0A174LN51_9CLOT|nr:MULTISPECIES: helix-turn-helix domain-containing protein [Clostridium]MCD2503245.1 AraC family transcriptional regulator [Clostridium sp. NSJ-145]CUP23140.1 AraC family transcriptional regulator [Clostridium disporicum]